MSLECPLPSSRLRTEALEGRGVPSTYLSDSGSLEISANRTHQALPVLTPATRDDGLRKSLELRRRRAVAKAQLAARPNNFPAVWHDDVAQGMKVYTLLLALPGVGKKKAAKLLSVAGIPEKTTVRACGPRQYERLMRQLAT